MQQLTDYWFDNYRSEGVASHFWSTVKLDLYGLQFYYAHVLRKPWVAPGYPACPIQGAGLCTPELRTTNA